MVTKSYTDARAHLAELYDRVVNNRETVIITRRNMPSVALIAEDELESLLETVHLMRSPANAARLLEALEHARAGSVEPSTVEKLRAEIRMDDEGFTRY